MTLFQAWLRRTLLAVHLSRAAAALVATTIGKSSWQDVKGLLMNAVAVVGLSYLFYSGSVTLEFDLRKSSVHGRFCHVVA